MPGEKAPKHRQLQRPVVLLSVKGEYFRQAHSRLSFDQPVELHERYAELSGEQPSDGCLAGPAQPQQGDEPSAGRGGGHSVE